MVWPLVVTCKALLFDEINENDTIDKWSQLFSPQIVSSIFLRHVLYLMWNTRVQDKDNMSHFARPQTNYHWSRKHDVRVEALCPGVKNGPMMKTTCAEAFHCFSMTMLTLQPARVSPTDYSFFSLILTCITNIYCLTSSHHLWSHRVLLTCCSYICDMDKNPKLWEKKLS
jgi:hypothetical protein